MTNRIKLLLLLLIVGSSCSLTGCTTIPSWAAFGPLATNDNSDYPTPAMRIDTIREYASQSSGLDSEDQREITDQLARQIQIEPDPLVRQTIVETIGKFRTPLAQQVLQAGLSDADTAVQIACCQQLGKRSDAGSVQTLANALKNKKDIDVRLAAADALGKTQSPEAIRALSVALEDNDPAMQFVGVESLRNLSGKDYGGDVAAWRQFVAGDATQVQAQPTSIAERVRQASPF